MLQHIDERLRRWAEWNVRRTEGGIGYPRQANYTRLGGSSGMGYCEIPDEEAWEIEQIVTSMGEILKVSVRTWYFDTATIEQKARRLGVSHMALRKYIDLAHQYIDEQLKFNKTNHHRDSVSAAPAHV